MTTRTPTTSTSASDLATAPPASDDDIDGQLLEEEPFAELINISHHVHGEHIGEQHWLTTTYSCKRV